MPAGGGDDVLETATRIHEAVEEPFEIGGLSLAVKASVGGVLYPDDASDSDTLVRFADVAMYAAKRNRTRIELYNPAVDVSSRESLSLGSGSGAPSTQATSSRTTSRRSRSRAAGSSVPRRSSAGITPSAGSSCRRSSCRSCRRQG